LLLHAGTTTTVRGRGIEKRKNSCNWLRLDGQNIEIRHLMWDAQRSLFGERSRHLYPRFPGFLEDIEDAVPSTSASLEPVAADERLAADAPAPSVVR
jgi:hypothetical protein